MSAPTAARQDAWFTSGGSRCAAWYYPPASQAEARTTCVVMAHGFSMTRSDGLPPFAEAFAAAGLHVLVFDHRHLGDSGGEPRQRFRIAEQEADWENAIAYAGGLDGVEEVVLWGFSFAGGHCVNLAARRRDVAAVLLVCPFLDGVARVRSTAPSTIAWILPRALLDLLGRPVLIPVTSPPGSRAAMTLPGEADGFARAIPAGSRWRNAIGPGLFATVATYRPVTKAGKVRCPAWVGLGERDVSASGAAIERFARRAPKAELQGYPYDHFEPFLDEAPARIAADQLAFLRRHGLA